MKPLTRQRLDKTRPHLRRDDEETIGLAMVRGELGEELVVRDARGRCQLCLGADFRLDPFGDLCRGCDALKILRAAQLPCSGISELAMNGGGLRPDRTLPRSF